MSNTSHKIIVTNLSALKAKYGAAGVTKIRGAVKKLIAADKNRGLTTILVALDDAAAMKKLKAPRVTVEVPAYADAKHAKQYKRAIDAVCKAYAPDYLMLLGAIDVIPHQNLNNPLYTGAPEGDPDQFAFGDLPYACDHAYSQEPKDFIGATRVVGRLPDLTGASGDPAYMIDLLNHAAQWKQRPAADYRKYLGISAELWKDSTALSLTNIFGDSAGMQTSPSAGHRWKQSQLGTRVHFINCHGGDTYPNFLGQSSVDPRQMPISHEAAYVGASNRIREGTVAAAECCYGGQLYDPSAVAGQAGMCNTYLASGAYGFFGSTTVAYGPAAGNDAADLICQYFVRRVLEGASTGRAALEARQKFVKVVSPIGPTNLKTLAQFNLYGDPSIAPALAASSHMAVAPKSAKLADERRVGDGASALLPKALGFAGADAKARRATEAHQRAERRDKLRVDGLLLARTHAVAGRKADAPSGRTQTALQKLAKQFDLTTVEMLSFGVQTPATRSTALPKSPAGQPLGIAPVNTAKTTAGGGSNTTAFHVIVGVKPPNGGSSVSAASSGQAKSLAFAGTPKTPANAGTGNGKAAGNDAPSAPTILKLYVLEAKEVNGDIVAVSELQSK